MELRLRTLLVHHLFLDLLPSLFPLEKRLKDVLEPEVDDKYVLSDTAIEGFLKHNLNHLAKGTGFLFKPKEVDLPDEGGAR